MNFNNKVIYGATGIAVFIIVKIIIGNIGIENIPIPIIISLFVISYTMFIVDIYNRKLEKEEKKYYIICSILMLVMIISSIIFITIFKVFPLIAERYKILMGILLIIVILILVLLAIIGTIIKKKYHS